MTNMDYIIRKARERDNLNIAKTLAHSFEKVVSVLIKDMECAAKILENGIAIDRFYVAEQNEEIIGIIACGDCTGRVINITKEDCKKHLGLIRGTVAFKLLSSNLMQPLSYPVTTGYIEVVGVLQQARGKGVAKKMLQEVIKNNTKYNEFILEVDSINSSAIKSYTDSGFVEFKRVPVVKFFKRSRIFMKYEVRM